MPHSKKRCLRASDGVRNKRTTVRNRRELDRQCKKYCGSATLDFADGRLPSDTCTKYYSLINSTTISSFTFPSIRNAEWAQANKPLCALVSPIDATSAVVTWNYSEFPSRSNPLSRYIITVERDTGCRFVPIAKFQVSVSMVPINDCEQVERSDTNGASRPFAVKICAGDLLVVNILQFLAEDCPVECGVPVDPAESSIVYQCLISVQLS
jgi:hypothetical protein